jgi:hypothetical protein
MTLPAAVSTSRNEVRMVAPRLIEQVYEEKKV